ncbi:uncharacterized protein LOC131890919 [Tigriopus californicus]|uniref:uncharacterized protein LOC131890919 n=1 Tax=Tigriopus californicus TaxID=6832 RepID=UPI0027DAA426|nr:uncharacterized protein LOC131890919 [Tigriopus californicus]
MVRDLVRMPKGLPGVGAGSQSVRFSGALVLFQYCLYSLRTADAQFAWTNIQQERQPIEGQVDLWTEAESGCSCSYDVLDQSCACCVPQGGCHCGAKSPHRCGQCGLEQFCDNMCNITLTSRDLESRSGQAYGEIKSPSALSGPAFCWYRFIPEPGQRVEVQVYRIKRLGKIDPQSMSCVGGFMQLISGLRGQEGLPSGNHLKYHPSELSICGQNERYFPPLVLFQDVKDASSGEANEATLIFRVDEVTSRSQFLAHYSFTPIDSLEDTAVQLRGATPLTRSFNDDGTENTANDCTWLFEEESCQKDESSLPNRFRLPECQLASPAYPGVYPPNRRCQYLIRRGQKSSFIRLTFTHFNLPPGQCQTHYVAVYRGRTNRDPLYQKLCGYGTPQSQTLLFKGEENILVEFRSGDIVPPINFNGFVAKLEFVDEAAQEAERMQNNQYGLPRGASSDSHGYLEDHHDSRHPQTPDQEEVYDENDYDEDYEHDYDEGDDEGLGEGAEDQDDDHDEDYADDEDGEETQIHHHQESVWKQDRTSAQKPKLTGQSGSCIQEYYGNQTRSGRISSNDLQLSDNDECTLVFKGNPGDVLVLQLTTFKLRGKSCEASITISVPTQLLRHPGESNIIDKICSPVTQRLNDLHGRGHQNEDGSEGRKDHEHQRDPTQPLLVNFSTVMLNFRAHRPSIDRFDGVFKFQHVLSEGFPTANTSCDRVFPGRTSPANGAIFGPQNWNLLLSETMPNSKALKCSTTLIPAESQSVTIMLKSSTPDDRDLCETQCDYQGCRCLVDGSLDETKHILITDIFNGVIGCFCGDFSHLLPLSIISSASLILVSNEGSSSGRHRKPKRRSTFSYTASYSFHNEETCGPRRIASPLGSLESPLSHTNAQSYFPSSTYFHQHCQWFFDPPPARQLVLEISTTDNAVDCNIWNATIGIWDVDTPTKLGPKIDRFCPEIMSKEYVLDTTNKKIAISLQSLSSRPIHYRIAWETRGYLSRNSVLSAGSKEPIGNKYYPSISSSGLLGHIHSPGGNLAMLVSGAFLSAIASSMLCL